MYRNKLHCCNSIDGPVLLAIRALLGSNSNAQEVLLGSVIVCTLPLLPRMALTASGRICCMVCCGACST